MPVQMKPVNLLLRAVAAVAVLGTSYLDARADGTSEAFVTNQLDDSVSIVDLRTMSAGPPIAIGGKPAGIAVSRDGSRAFVTTPEGRELVVVDATSHAVIARTTVGKGPLGVAVNPVSGVVYVADWYGNELLAYDPLTLAILARAPTGTAPSGIAISPDGSRVIVTDREDDAVSVYETAGLARLGKVATGKHHRRSCRPERAMAPDGKCSERRRFLPGPAVHAAGRHRQSRPPALCHRHRRRASLRHKPGQRLAERDRPGKPDSRCNRACRWIPGGGRGQQRRQHNLRRLLGG